MKRKRLLDMIFVAFLLWFAASSIVNSRAFAQLGSAWAGLEQQVSTSVTVSVDSCATCTKQCGASVAYSAPEAEKTEGKQTGGYAKPGCSGCESKLAATIQKLEKRAAEAFISSEDRKAIAAAEEAVRTQQAGQGGEVNVIRTEFGTFRHLAAGDLDGDGVDDIVAGISFGDFGNRSLGAFKGDGTVLWINDTIRGCLGAIAMGDIDDDGRNEVVTSDWFNTTAFEHDGTFKWEQGEGYGGFAHVTIIANVYGDSKNEITTACDASTSLAVMNGSNGDVIWRRMTYDWDDCINAAGVGDIDGDGDNEIVAGYTDNCTLVAFEGDGTEIWREHLTLPGLYEGRGFKCIRVVDLDWDGKAEIIAAGQYYEDVYTIGATFVLDENGDTLWDPYVYTGHNPRHAMVGNIATGDLDGDGVQDIVVGGGYDNMNDIHGMIYALSGGDGGELWTYHTGGCCCKAVAVGDVDGDGVNEVAAVTGYFQAWPRVVVLNNVGTEIYSLTAPEYCCARSLIMADVDGNPDMEVVAGVGRQHEVGHLYVIDFKEAPVRPVGGVVMPSPLRVLTAIVYNNLALLMLGIIITGAIATTIAHTRKQTPL